MIQLMWSNISTWIAEPPISAFLVQVGLAAIQSSVSSFVLIIAGSIKKDLYVDCFGGKAKEKILKQINIILFAVFCCLCALIALNQDQKVPLGVYRVWF